MDDSHPDQQDNTIPSDGSPPEPASAIDDALAFAFGADTTSPSILQRVRALTGHVPGISLRDADPSGQTPMLKPLAPGETRATGRYVIQGMLGAGGVGIVHRGHDQDLGRDVALKFLHEKYADNSDILHRFVEEAQIGGQLQHPGIVPVYELGMAGTRPFFVMKMIKGETLARKLTQRTAVTEDKRGFLSIFEDVCQTIAYAHASGVVHRDLKPANVMIGSFGEVQVVDWGMGKVLQSGGTEDEKLAAAQHSQLRAIETVRSAGHGTQSIMGSVMGTPAYMPPEQARGDVEAMDERSDVFALGAILCELLTGLPPYVGQQNEMLTQAATGDLQDAYERIRNCGADDDLIALANSCLQAERAARPASAQLVATAIHDHLSAAEARAHRARVEAAEARVRATALKRQRTLAAALALAITTGLAFSLWLYRQAEAQREAAEGQRQVAEQQRDQVGVIADFMSETLAGATPSMALGRDTKILEEMLGAAEARIRNGELEHSPEAERQLRLTIAQTYRTIGQMDRARAMILPAVAIARATLPPDDPRLAQTLTDYAIVRFKADEDLERATTEAITVSREAVAIRRKHPEAPSALASALDDLAFYLASAGDNKEARQLAAEAVAIHRTLPYAGETGLARALHRLACTQQALGEISAATTSFEEAIKIQRRLYPSGHPDLAASLAVFGGILSENELPRAEPMLVEALEMRRQLISGATDATVGTLERLAKHYERTGQAQAAVPLRREALEMRRQMHAPGHQRIATALISLCLTMSDAGQLLEAAPQFEDALALAEQSEFVTTEDRAIVLNGLAVIYFQRGEYARSETYCRRNLELEKALGAAGDVDASRKNLARALYHQATEKLASGNAQEALKIIREARGLAAALDSGDPPWLIYRAAIFMALGRSLNATGDLEGARRAFLESLATAERNPEGDFGQLLAHYTLAGVFPDDADSLDHARSAHEIATQALPLGDPDRNNCRELFCVLLTRRGELAETELVRSNAVAAFRNMYPDGSVELANAIIELSVVLRQRTELDRAAAGFREALQMAEPLGGVGQGHTVRARIGLGRTLRIQGNLRAAEPALLAAEKTAASASPDLHREAIVQLVGLYNALHATAPDAGHQETANRWQRKLKTLQAQDR